jgi:hypothetical protein
MPPFTVEALRILRDPSHFQWTLLPFIGVAVYIYAVEIERRNWSAVFAGLAFWLMDWVNEIINALVLHFTHYAALWTTTGTTSFQILVGLNIEISLLFLTAGIVFTKQLPPDPRRKILGLNNRVWMVLGFSCFSVLVELLLHRTGSFHWAYPFWNVPHVELIVIFGYGTFYAMAAWVHDTPRLATKVRAVGALAAVVAAGLIAFGPIAGWL